MADLNARIKPKKSSTAGEVPQAEDLEVSEIAVNTADGKLFTKHTDNSIKEISGGGAVDSVNGQTGVVSLGVQDMNDYKDAPVPQTAGYLWNDYLNSNQLWDYATAGKYQIVLSAGSTDWALKICSVDSSSTDRDADWLTVQIGDELTLSEDGNTWYTFVVGVISRYDSTTSPSYVNPVYSIGLDEVSVGVPDMAAWTTGFYTDPTYDPSVLTAPSNGQTLTWDAIDGSWRPADAAGGGAVTTLDNVGDVQYYVPPGSYDGLTDSTGSTSSASLTTSGQWFVSTNPAYFNFHQDQSTEMSLLQTGDEVTFEAYGLSHTTTLTTSPVAGSGVVWYFQVSPTFPAAWKGPTLPAGQALKVINNTRFPNTTPDDPLDKQALIWNGTDSEWQPTSTIQSVNGRIGDAVIGVDELDDYAGWLKYNVISSGSLLPDAGEAIINHASGWDFYLNTTDADGTSDGGGLGTLANGDPGQIKLNDGTLVDVTVNSTGNNTGSRLTVNFIDDSFLSSVSDGDVIYIQFTGKAYGLSAADGQVLTWVDANSQWEPADAPADAVSSVNGQTGVVSLVLSDLSDVGTATGGTPFRYNNEVAGSASVVTDGDWVYTSGIIVFDHIDADGQDATTGLYNQLSATGNPSSGSIWVSTDGVTFTEEVYTATFNFGDTDTRYGIATATSYSGSGEIWIAATEPTTQASDGQVLTWVDTNSQWEPAGLQGAAVRTALGIGEYVDDAAAGTGGVASGALYYNTTSSDYRLKT